MILQALRTGTATEHRRLEDRLDLPRRLTTPGAYRALLERFYGFYLPIESLLAAREEWGTLALDFARRRKTPLLGRDLRALGLGECAIGALPRCTVLPAIATFPQALGCLYVLEGATLGGQIIARQVQHTLAIGQDSSAGFFRAYGGEVGPMWRAFGLAIASYPADPPTVTAIVTSARDTFGAFERWLLPGRADGVPVAAMRGEETR